MYQPENEQLRRSIEISQFYEALSVHASSINLPSSSIYEHVSRDYPIAASEISQEQAALAIHYIRKSCNPPLPHNLSMMGQTITSLRWQARLLNVIDERNRVPFFRGNLEFLENNALCFGGLFFANISFLQRHTLLFRKSRLLAVDRTFGVMPHYPVDMHQLITIHVILENVSVPVLYAILNDETEIIYMRLWQFLKYELLRDIFEWDRMQIIIDYEIAMRNAVRIIIPESRLIGCWFHYSQNIIRYVQTHNIVQMMRNNHDIATIIQMIIALPHLPPEMIPNFPNDFHIVGGFMAIQSLARNMNIYVELNDIFEYIQNFWIDIVRPNGFSVFGFNVQTNDYIESFHNMIKIIIGHHPPVWTFWDRLRSVENMVRRETEQIINGQQVRRSIITARDTNNTVLLSALQYVRNGRYNTMSFLRIIANSTNGCLNQQMRTIPSYINHRGNTNSLEPLTSLSPQSVQVINEERYRQFGGRGYGQAQNRQNYTIPWRRFIPTNRSHPRSHVINMQQLENIEENVVESSENLNNVIAQPIVTPLEIENNSVEEINQQQPRTQIVVNQELQPIAEVPAELAVDEATTSQTKEQYLDRCFICLCDYNDVKTQNFLLPCGHGWCCNDCGERLNNCPICKAPYPSLQPIRVTQIAGHSVPNYSLTDPARSQCLGCWRYMKDVPNKVRYIYLFCGHGWFCSECAMPPPFNCETCNSRIEGILQIYLG